MGIVVDWVQKILDIPGDAIEDAPEFGNEVNTDYILGMGKCEDRVTILLEIAKVVSREDIASLESAAEAG
jgi:purine-binding chemotaxis protein CheW